MDCYKYQFLIFEGRHPSWDGGGSIWGVITYEHFQYSLANRRDRLKIVVFDSHDEVIKEEEYINGELQD